MAKAKKKAKDLSPKSKAKKVKGGVTVGTGKDGAVHYLAQGNVAQGLKKAGRGEI